MFSTDILNRIYEQDKTSAIALMLTGACLQKMEASSVTPMQFNIAYDILHPLAIKIVKQIDDAEVERNTRYQKDSVAKMNTAYLSNTGTSGASAPKMRATPK